MYLMVPLTWVVGGGGAGLPGMDTFEETGQTVVLIGMLDVLTVVLLDLT